MILKWRKRGVLTSGMSLRTGDCHHVASLAKKTFLQTISLSLFRRINCDAQKKLKECGWDNTTMYHHQKLRPAGHFLQWTVFKRTSYKITSGMLWH